MLENKKITKTPGVRVAVVEEDENVRRQWAELMQNAGDLKLVAAFKDGATAILGILSANPDVVVMDIQLPGIDGIECARILKEQLPAVNVIVLTTCEDSQRLYEALWAGVSGYLLKGTSPAHLLEAIREVHEGGSPMTPQIARKVVQYFFRANKASNDARASLAHLSPGETKALDELARGYAYKIIADHLGISVHGVRNYIRKIYEKLQVHSRTEAVIKYLRHRKPDPASRVTDPGGSSGGRTHSD